MRGIHDDRWMARYLMLVYDGTGRGKACADAGVHRQLVSEKRKADPDFARDEQLAKDRAHVDRLVEQLGGVGE